MEDLLKQEALVVQDVGNALDTLEDKFAQARMIKYMIDFYDLEDFIYQD